MNHAVFIIPSASLELETPILMSRVPWYTAVQ